jgi:hypothetical protein
MEQENAQAKLAGGLKLERGDLDALIMEFEQLVHHAGYDINQELVLCVFTSALPDAMYAHIMRGPKPQSYEDWRHTAIEQQKLYTHMKNRVDRFKTSHVHHQTTNHGIITHHESPTTPWTHRPEELGHASRK